MAVVRRGDEMLASLGSDPSDGREFYRLLGGGVDFGETGEQALRREFREELGAELDDVRSLGVVENIFTWNAAPGHEVVLMFSARLRDAGLYDRDDLVVLDSGDPVGWVPLADVRSGRILLFPEGPHLEA
ncbi:NUDIX hydrolase [Pseudonocardia ailaonensis]|uniref:NUDIX hydrolase n=2 Tax=Pseudonocardia ailaonensis TaxID=367279 RepID=A0ABN2NPT2_9PSEU